MRSIYIYQGQLVPSRPSRPAGRPAGRHERVGWAHTHTGQPESAEQSGEAARARPEWVSSVQLMGQLPGGEIAEWKSECVQTEGDKHIIVAAKRPLYLFLPLQMMMRLFARLNSELRAAQSGAKRMGAGRQSNAINLHQHPWHINLRHLFSLDKYQTGRYLSLKCAINMCALLVLIEFFRRRRSQPDFLGACPVCGEPRSKWNPLAVGRQNALVEHFPINKTHTASFAMPWQKSQSKTDLFAP